MQKVYVYYAGNGSERYFTSPNDNEAADFLRNDIKLNGYSSAFACGVSIQAKGSYWLRGGIPIHTINIIPEAESLPKPY